MAVEDSRQAGATIEVTPQMIEAGCDFLAEWDSPYYDGPFSSASAFVSELFRRMDSKSLSPTDFPIIAG